MIDKGINVKKIDLSGVSFPTNDASTCALIYTAVHNTYGFPLYLTNFKINDEKRDSVLVSPIILENQTIINLNDCHLIVTPTEISVSNGVYGAFLESIVDKDGNPRFVEGDGILATIDGLTFTYNKWSLSGSHLMAVLCGTIDANTIIEGGIAFCWFTLPSWIYDKIIEVRDDKLIDYKEIPCFKETGFAQTTLPMRLEKATNNRIAIIKTGRFITNDALSFRIQFDLLIDADYNE